MKLRSIQLARTAALGLALVVAAGCGAAGTDDRTVAAAQAAARASGPVGAVEGALGELGLAAEQKAAAGRLVADARAEIAPVRAGFLALSKELAAGVRAGAIDRLAAEARLAEIARAIDAARPAVQKALGSLHQTLDAEQRESLVEALRDSVPLRKDRRGGMRQVLAELDLDAAQMLELRSLMKSELGGDREAHKQRRGEMRAKVQAAGEAFASEDFDPTTLGLGDDASTRLVELGQKFLRVAERALPVLRPAQRETVAKLIESRAAALE